MSEVNMKVSVTLLAILSIRQQSSQNPHKKRVTRKSVLLLLLKVNKS